MLLAFIAVVVGLVLLIWSAEKFIDGAAATSRWLGLSPLLIGMLVIGFGTSAPEMMVSVLAAMQGNPGLAVGNAYGSNIANIGLVLGFIALISPLAVHSGVIRKEMPLLVAVMLLTGYMLFDGWISRVEAIVLLVALGIFIAISIIRSRGQEDDPLLGEVTESLDSNPMSRGKAIMWTLIGLVLLIASSRLLVWGAVEIAVAFGVSDLIIGLTVVAFSWRGRPRRINRVEGGVLFAIFIAYTGYMVSIVVMS